MCFSASASFTASTALALIGAKSIHQTKDKNQMPFAIIPLFFALQQCCEGILWLALTNENLSWLTTYATYSFLFFAFILWPVWIPSSIMSFTKDRHKQTMLSGLVCIGALVSGTLLYHLVRFGASALVQSCHIVYLHSMSAKLSYWGSIGYLAAIITPFFIPDNKRLWALGTLLALAYSLSYYAYYTYLISVWCFFAAIISFGILFVNNSQK